ncbi:YegS/Rv2252/BmrU family lipid kinase [Aquibacillus halophilus]|uniref:YegS/Rv2252/BmrU family lipid kinase n=1 Tax=Aquibacillus halophilus TaxID=930132 RepID=A0A6A8D8A7_9BACI|nr:diacylglycerol kinase family protein [Aquibacillus halophilus]MRH41993.1 YegS/Rv2252/BmrU family lipid kinase [Aquibacillus halophilus]
MERVAIIYNPASGKRKLSKFIHTITSTLRNQFQDVRLYQTEKEGDATCIVNQVGSSVDYVIAAGGDGTVNEIVNAICLLDHRPTLAIIPGGTSNDFSRAIGMSQNPLKATDQLLEKQLRDVDVGKADDSYFLNFWGIGLVTEVAQNVDSDAKENFGQLAYYIRTAQTMGQAKPFHVQLDAGSVRIDEEVVMMIVGNGMFTGGVNVFFPKADIQDGMLDVILIKETSVQVFWSMLQSKLVQEPSIEEE